MAAMRRPSSAGLVIDPTAHEKETRRKAAAATLERINNTPPLMIEQRELIEAIAEAEATGVLKSLIVRAQSKGKYAEKVQLAAQKKKAEDELTKMSSMSLEETDLDAMKSAIERATTLGVSATTRKRSMTRLQEAEDTQSIAKLDKVRPRGAEP